MWELICHHTYKLEGLPVDLSHYASDGERESTGFQPDGVAPGSGALRFAQAQSRVTIPMSPNSAFRTLGGLKVEVTARVLTRAGHWQTLIAGDGAFNFFLRDHHVIAEFPTPPGKSTLTWAFSGPNHDGISTAEHGQPPLYYVRTGTWATFGLLHDGLDAMELSVDGEVIARRTGLQAGIPGVGPLGVTIGNWPGNALVLEGDIDEVKVWRPDPQAMRRLFLSRPFDEASAQCWERLFRCLQNALARHPDCAAQLAAEVPAVFDGLQRAIVAKGPETRERYAKVCAEYARLWRAGQLDSPEMATLIADWCTWLRLVGLSLGDDPALRAFLASKCMAVVREACQDLGFDCDPKATALIGLLTAGCGHSKSATAL